MNEERLDNFITIRFLIDSLADQNSYKLISFFDGIVIKEFNDEFSKVKTTEEFFAMTDQLNKLLPYYYFKMKKSTDKKIAWQFEGVDERTIKYKISNSSHGQTLVENMYRNMTITQ